MTLERMPYETGLLASIWAAKDGFGKVPPYVGIMLSNVMSRVVIKFIANSL